jgi:hypothetical protein
MLGLRVQATGPFPCCEFFSTLRKYTADGFFASEIGIKYLGYSGNTYLKEFPGCPAIPDA